MYWQPAVLPIAPSMVGQTDGHRRGTPRPALAQTFMRHHKVIETASQPEPSPVAAPAPGQTPGATAPWGPQAAPRAIPPCHKGRLAHRAELPQAQWCAQAVGTTAEPPLRTSTTCPARF